MICCNEGLLGCVMAIPRARGDDWRADTRRSPASRRYLAVGGGRHWEQDAGAERHAGGRWWSWSRPPLRSTSLLLASAACRGVCYHRMSGLTSHSAAARRVLTSEHPGSHRKAAHGLTSTRTPALAPNRTTGACLWPRCDMRRGTQHQSRFRCPRVRLSQSPLTLHIHPSLPFHGGSILARCCCASLACRSHIVTRRLSH